MSKTYIRLLLGLWLSWCVGAQASTTSLLQLDTTQSAEKMQPYLSVWQDLSAALPAETVVANPEKFESVETEFINADLTNAKIWLRFDMQNIDIKDGEWAIATDSMRIDYLSLYKLSDGVLKRVYHSNFFSRGDEREIVSPNIYIPISLAAQAKATFFLEYQSQGTVKLNLDVLDLQQLQEKIRVEYILDFMLIGFFLALAAINLFHFLALRQPAHFYYSLLMLASVAKTLSARNYFFIYVFPDSLEIVRLITPFAGNAAVAFGVLFTRQFFDLKTLSKPLYLASHIGLALLLLPCMAAFFTSYNTVLTLMIFTSPPVILLMVFVGFYALYKGRPSAAYYVVAWFFYAAGLLYLAFSVRGFHIGGMSGTDIGLLGSAIEGLVLSMALAHRVRHVHAQKQQAQNRLITTLERNNDIQAELFNAERAKFQALNESYRKSQKLAATSHDFASPLLALQASLSALHSKKGTDSSQETISAIENIRQTLDYLKNLSTSLVTDERAQQQAAQESFMLSEVFVDVFNRYAVVAEEKQLSFFFVASSKTLSVNRLAVTRILENFVNNALRYTDSGKVFFGARRRKGAIELQVLDTGPGIRPEVEQKIKKAFTQSGDLANEHQGFGLGLSITHSLCHEFGYTMKLTSIHGRGSKFSVVIPK